MANARKPKQWVSHINSPECRFSTNSLSLSLVCFGVACRESTSLSLCPGQGLGLQKVHPQRFPSRRGQRLVTRRQAHSLLRGIYSFLIKSLSLSLSPWLGFLVDEFSSSDSSLPFPPSPPLPSPLGPTETNKIRDLFAGERRGGQCQYLRPIECHPIQSSRMSSGRWLGSLIWEPAFQRRHLMRQRAWISGRRDEPAVSLNVPSLNVDCLPFCRPTKRYWPLGVRCSRPCSNTRWKSGSTIVSRSQTWNRRCSARCCASSTRAKRPTWSVWLTISSPPPINTPWNDSKSCARKLCAPTCRRRTRPKFSSLPISIQPTNSKLKPSTLSTRMCPSNSSLSLLFHNLIRSRFSPFFSSSSSFSSSFSFSFLSNCR